MTGFEPATSTLARHQQPSNPYEHVRFRTVQSVEYGPVRAVDGIRDGMTASRTPIPMQSDRAWGFSSEGRLQPLTLTPADRHGWHPQSPDEPVYPGQDPTTEYCAPTPSPPRPARDRSHTSDRCMTKLRRRGYWFAGNSGWHNSNIYDWTYDRVFLAAFLPLVIGDSPTSTENRTAPESDE